MSDVFGDFMIEQAQKQSTEMNELRAENDRLKRFEKAWEALVSRAPGLGETLDVMTALEKEFRL